MERGTERLKELSDERLPAMQAVLGEEAAALLSAALGGRDVLEARPTQVNWWPGRSLTAVHQATLTGPDGELLTETFGIATGDRLPDGAIRVTDGEATVAAWRFPLDPSLPGLAAAMEPASARKLLDAVEAPPGAVSCAIRAYRPLRRAVVELTSGGTRLFVKALAPDRIATLQTAHRAAEGRLRVPRSHGWSPEFGLVVLEALPGATLRQALDHPSMAVPPPGDLLGMLDRLPEPPDGRITRGPLGPVREHGGLLARLLPEHAARVQQLTASLEREATEEPLVPVHGDFYEAQVMVQDGRLSGLLDIDTLGRGRRSDDLATMVGHLAVWGPSSRQPERVRSYARELLTIADRLVDPAMLRRKVAAVVLGLATGPFRVQSERWPEETLHRLAMAERWFDSATATTRPPRPCSRRPAA